MANHISIRRDRFRETVRRFRPAGKTLARALLVEALMRANWKDGENPKGRDVLDLKRGEFPMGWNEMADDLGCSVQELRTVMKRFVAIEEFTRRSTNRGTIVTVKYYDDYIDDRPKNNRQNNKQTTSKQQANNNTKDSKETQYTKEQQHPIPKVDRRKTNGIAKLVDVVGAFENLENRSSETQFAEAVKLLQKIGIKPLGEAKKLASGYAIERIREVVTFATTSSEVRDPASYTVMALKDEYQLARVVNNGAYEKGKKCPECKKGVIDFHTPTKAMMGHRPEELGRRFYKCNNSQCEWQIERLEMGSDVGLPKR